MAGDLPKARCKLRHRGRSLALELLWLGSALTLGALIGCAPQGRRPPNIILITIDTLRSDHLSCYGYPRSTTPAIDRIAAMGTVFEQAYATSSWTVPSTASIITGLHPRTHGVRHGVFSAGSGRISEQEVLDPRFPTLATTLNEAGYETFGLTSNAHLAADAGFDHGFDTFVTLPFKSAFRLDQELATWRARIAEASHYFLWIHYFDPHAPYSSREPWITEYDQRLAEPRAQGAHDEWPEMVTREMDTLAKSGPPAGFRDGLIALYDSEINFVDRSIGRLLAQLGPLDDTAIVITSDHGEEFLDRGGFGHKHSLHEELLRVPLIVKRPIDRDASQRIEVPVSNLDVFPTLLAFAGLEEPPGLDGRSLLRLIAQTSEQAPGVEPTAIYAELDTTSTSGESVRVGPWKLISMTRPEAKVSLFDLDDDPGEVVDLALARKDVVVALTATLEHWREAHPLFEPTRTSLSIGEPVIRQLRAMGYVE